MIYSVFVLFNRLRTNSFNIYLCVDLLTLFSLSFLFSIMQNYKTYEFSQFKDRLEVTYVKSMLRRKVRSLQIHFIALHRFFKPIVSPFWKLNDWRSLQNMFYLQFWIILKKAYNLQGGYILPVSRILSICFWYFLSFGNETRWMLEIEYFNMGKTLD